MNGVAKTVLGLAHDAGGDDEHDAVLFDTPEGTKSRLFL